MKKPAKLLKKSISVKSYQGGGFRLIIGVGKSTLFSFSHHSPYWHCKCEMENMLNQHDKLNKSTYKSIQIGRWRWVASDTRKRMHCNESRKTYTKLKKVGKK